jgi:ABC-2 type transport system ATP-binding protein
VAGHGTSVVLSSHLVADLELICDYLVVLVASRVRLAGDIAALLASHHQRTGRPVRLDDLVVTSMSQTGDAR